MYVPELRDSQTLYTVRKMNRKRPRWRKFVPFALAVAVVGLVLGYAYLGFTIYLRWHGPIETAPNNCSCTSTTNSTANVQTGALHDGLRPTTAVSHSRSLNSTSSNTLSAKSTSITAASSNRKGSEMAGNRKSESVATTKKTIATSTAVPVPVNPIVSTDVSAAPATTTVVTASSTLATTAAAGPGDMVTRLVGFVTQPASSPLAAAEPEGEVTRLVGVVTQPASSPPAEPTRLVGFVTQPASSPPAEVTRLVGFVTQQRNVRR